MTRLLYVFGMPCRIVERNESTASDAKQMKFLELEMIDQSCQDRPQCCRAAECGRIRCALAPAAPVESDDAIAGLRECGDLRLPDIAVPVLECNSTIGVPEPPLSVYQSFTPEGSHTCILLGGR